MFHQEITYFKMTIPPFITGTKYYEHGMASSSPDMNIIENFWRKLKQGNLRAVMIRIRPFKYGKIYGLYIYGNGS